MVTWSKIFILLFVGTAVGCVIWLGFFHDAHDFRQQLSQEDRHAELVGAKPLPKAAIVIVIDNHKNECVRVDSAEFNGSEIWVYLHNDCRTRRNFIKVSWKAKAPDGTIIESQEHYAGAAESGLLQGEKLEYHADRFKDDPRIQSVVVWASSDDL
jgi:hypothetical protein